MDRGRMGMDRGREEEMRRDPRMDERRGPSVMDDVLIGDVAGHMVGGHEQANYAQPAEAVQPVGEPAAAAAEPASVAAPAAPAPAAVHPDLVAELEQLSVLKNTGVLSDAEFTEAKAKLLGT